MGGVLSFGVSTWRWIGLPVLLACLAAPAHAQVAPEDVPVLIYTDVHAMPHADLTAAYAERQFRPIWFDAKGALDPAATLLVQLLESAEHDRIDRSALGLAEVSAALRQRQRWPSAATTARADVALSRSFDAYVRAMRQAPAGMIFADPALWPATAARTALRDAARAPSLAEHIRDMPWMHPMYVSLRQTLASGEPLDPAVREVAFENLARLRPLPARSAGRHVVVDAAGARLWMYEDGRAVDSMRVVVGKPGEQTPMIAGSLNRAIVNPYWNVPYDLVPRMIAAKVLRQGVSYLKHADYEVLSDWGETPSVVDPATVDWKAVARGEIELRVRQLPRFGNAMGKAKFEFPNEQGIYLHDTPEKGLMAKASRHFSSGCIRLEDADRFGRWLLQGPLPGGGAPEQKIALTTPVPVYVTYLTATVADGRVALGADPYGRDNSRRPALAVTGPAPSAEPH